ncbi:MAG: RNA-binding protein [Aureispira sp.]|nr:RNA-binding protein [Aureispira sp.]
MTISIASLNVFTRENALRELFEKFGKIRSVKIVKDDGLKISKGEGIVKMDSRESGLKAIEELNGRLIDGKNIEVREI